jgi:CRP/FNR family transcriptional regulator
MATTPREQISAALKRAQIFAGLSEPEMQSLASRAVRKIYDSGELLFSEGEPCEGFYIVLSGKIRIFKTSASGREQILAVEGPGSSVAELPVFDGGRYPASVAATEASEMIFISRRDFQAFCLEHPQVALKVLAVVGSRLRRLVGIIEELSFTTVRQRLVAHLLRLAEDTGTKSPTGIQITLPGSHQDLAHQIGTVRELVSRNLSRLQAEGLLELDARHILIRDLEGLKVIQQSSE